MGLRRTVSRHSVPSILKLYFPLLSKLKPYCAFVSGFVPVTSTQFSSFIFSSTFVTEVSSSAVPIISIVIGEGGSGGALALGVADRLYMLEHAVYSVISPEGCAAILWKKNGDLGTADFSKAAEALKLTAQDLLKFKIIDGIIPEPLGGAHREPETTGKNLTEYILSAVNELKDKTSNKLIEERYRRFRKIGSFKEEIKE